MGFEYTLESAAPYFEMQKAGAGPTDVARQAIRDGIPRVYVLALMRDVFSLGLQDGLKIVRQFGPCPDPDREAVG